MSHICSLQHEGAHSPGIEMNFLGNFPVVCDHFVVVSIINGVIRDPKLGHLNFRVAQFSMRNSCITQSVAGIEMICKDFIVIRKCDEI